MDVQCERCKTEYDFDDALVSGRGTTVRCTNCGHQFKVRKAEASEPGADRWQVRTASGQDLTFLTLRELQRAILAKQVGRGDVLRRGGGPPRAIGTIAELEPFFEGRASSRPPPPGANTSAVPRMPPQSAVPLMPQVAAPPAQEFPKKTASWGIPPDMQAPPLPPVRQKVDTLRPEEGGVAPPPRPGATPPPPPMASRTPPPPPARVPGASLQPQPHAASFAMAQTVSAQEPETLRRPPTPAPPMVEMSSPLPPPTAPVRRGPSRPSYDDDMPEMRPPTPSSLRDDYDPSGGRRRVGGWIVALVLVMAVGVVGWVVAKPYLAPRPVVAAATLDPRALGFVNDGERALGDGNLEAAQQAFDKASGVAERDPRVLVDEARVAAAKADLPWLRMRLLAPDAKDDLRATKADLDDRVARARATADAAMAEAANDVGAVRARIDALRLAGDRDTARKDVAKVIAQASQPETAYVLAALDLAEPDPLWTALVDRLRLAAAGEGNAGRARAALVYALAQSGDVAGAKIELGKLDALTRPYPLSTLLHAFVDRAKGRAAPSALDGGVASNVPHLDVSALPQQPAPGAAAAGGGGGGGGGDDTAVPGDNGSAMKAAQAAIRKGDWGRAGAIYNALVSRNPSDSEALSGLGDVARAQGDLPGALAAYKRALAVNPSYLPALLGAADTQWASGDKAGALRAYKDIVDRFPEGTYPAYVKSRVDAAAAPTSTTVVVPPAPTAKPAAPANSDGI